MNKGREVLDASALLAFMQEEPGGDSVDLERSLINTVNLCEVVQKTVQRERDVEGLVEDLAYAGLTIMPFSPEEAATAGKLWQLTRSRGLSLGDRACLASGLHYRIPVATAERVWTDVDHGVHVRVIR